MDLYEALKSGTTEEELLKAFHKDLDEATARIAAEERKEKEKKATEARKALAQAIANYSNVAWPSKDPVSVETIDKSLSCFETEFKDMINATRNLEKNLKSTNANISFISDDDVIHNFLKSLR